MKSCFVKHQAGPVFATVELFTTRWGASTTKTGWLEENLGPL